MLLVLLTTQLVLLLALLQALKQALEGANFREFADRVSTAQNDCCMQCANANEPCTLQKLCCCCAPANNLPAYGV
jgi:hypothetical protein